MSDIFISYARADQSVAKELADYLESQGFNVWWDTDLLGTDDFSDVIYSQLQKARAAIVIWTDDAVKSLFVRDEARFALKHKKLIAARTSALSIDKIPFGFQSLHTEDVHNRDKLVRAIESLGVTRNAPAPPPTLSDDQAWQRVAQSNDIDLLFSYLAEYPQNKYTALAKTRIRELIKTSAGEESPASFTRIGNASAFWSGLTLRVAEFLSTSSSNWVLVGLLIGYVAIGALGVVLFESVTPASLAIFLLMTALSWTHYSRFLAQQLQFGALVLGIVSVLSLSLSCLALVVVLGLSPEQPHPLKIVFILPIAAFSVIGWQILKSR